jgi:type IV pilus assembly protein PilP
MLQHTGSKGINMARLQNNYLIGLLIQIFIILAFVNIGMAAQEEAAGKDKETANIVAGTETPAQADAATAAPVEQYLYDPTGKTDPFKSFISTREEKEKERAKTYLETLELSQLNVVVIVISPKNRWAMVQDSKGVGHVIKEGTLIGTNNGVVYKITQGEVIIREEYKDFRGQTQYREISKVPQS